MILRRIADGFVRQDWATVVVEFVIVVAGIFLGLQVNNWNELRMERAEERTNLERPRARLTMNSQRQVACVSFVPLTCAT